MKNQPAQGFLLNGLLPPEAVGNEGLRFNSVPTGTLPMGALSVMVTVLGIDLNGKIVSITDPKRQQTIESAFRAGLNKWQSMSASVCGSKVTITPGMNLEFPATVTAPQKDKNLLYIALDRNRVPGGTGKLFYYGLSIPGDVHNYLIWTKQYEGSRGTGTIKPFTIIMPDLDKMKNEQIDGEDVSGNSIKMSGEEVWQITAAHEFGHAMGLQDTHLPGSILTNENPVGLMNACCHRDPLIHPAYIAEIISRVFECRMDITTTVDKIKAAPKAVNSEKWDFMGSASSKHTNVLTSQWGYFNWDDTTKNSCTVRNNAGKPGRKAPYWTYQLCTGDPTLNNADNIDFNLGEFPPDYFLWTQQPPTASKPVQNFTIAQGNCDVPAVLLENAGSVPLAQITPEFTLGTNGDFIELRDVNIQHIIAYAQAKDPDKTKAPLCSYGVFSWDGNKLPFLNKLTPPFKVSGFFNQETFGGYDNNIGKFDIEVSMKLVKK